MFRDSEVLLVIESDEPNNILWSNLEVATSFRLLGQITEFAVSVVLMYCVYLLVTYFMTYYPSYVALAITAASSMLPTMLLQLTKLGMYPDEDDRQNSLL